MTIHCSTFVQAPPVQAFAVFSDVEQAAKYIPAIVKTELLTPLPVGVGTRFRETRIMFNKEATEEMVFLSFDPPHGYTLAAQACGVHYETRFRFAPEEGGTRVTADMTMTPVTLMAKLMRPLFWMMASMMRNCLNEDLDALRKAAELCTAVTSADPSPAA